MVYLQHFKLCFDCLYLARIARGLLGDCLLCTPKQMVTLNKLLAYIQEKRPELYRLAVAKYLQNAGIQLPADEAAKVEELEKKEGLL